MKFISSLRRRWFVWLGASGATAVKCFRDSIVCRRGECTTRFPNAHQKPDVCLCSFWFFSAANDCENTEHTHTAKRLIFIGLSLSRWLAVATTQRPLIDALAFKFYLFFMYCLAVRRICASHSNSKRRLFFFVPRRGCRCHWAILMIIRRGELMQFSHSLIFFRAFFWFFADAKYYPRACNAHSNLYNNINLILIVIHLNTRVRFD